MKANLAVTQTIAKWISLVLLVAIAGLVPLERSWAQTTVFTDNFNRGAVVQPISNGGTPSMTWTTATTSTGSASATGATSRTNLLTGSDYALQILPGNTGATPTAQSAGATFVTGSLSTFGSPFNTTLSSNPASVTWTFNMRTNRTTALSGFTGSAYGSAVVLAASNTTLSNSANGYAVIQIKGTTTNTVRLIKFANGLAGTQTVLATGTGDLQATNTSWVNVKVTYNPSGNNWQLFADTSSTAAGPKSDFSTVTTQLGSTVSDNTYTSTALTTTGFYYNHSALGSPTSNTVLYDNFTVNTATTLPTVTTTTPGSITSSTALSGGNVTNAGGLTVFRRGLIYSTSPITDSNSTIGGGKLIDASTGTGTFTSNLSSLNPSTQYYVRAFALNAAGVAYGAELNFTTSAASSLPSITTTTPSNVNGTTATVGGNVVSDNGDAVIRRGIIYSTSSITDTTNTTGGGKQIDNAGGTGAFSLNLNGLSTSTTYFTRAFAVNSSGVALGTQESFTTLANDVAALPSAQPTNLTFSSVTCNGMTVNWTAASGSPAGYLVLRTSGSTAPNTDPSMMSSYSQGATLGNATVAYVGSETSFSMTGIADTTQYNFKIYSYNGTGTSSNYLTSSPLSGSASTAATPKYAATSATNVFSNSFTANWSGTSECSTGNYLTLNATEDFENSLSIFTATGGVFSTGLNSGGLPSSTPLSFSGSYGYQLSNGVASLTSRAINTSGLTSPKLSFKVAALSFGSTANGLDTGDSLNVFVSPDNGVTWHNTIRVSSSIANGYWSFGVARTVTTPYDGEPSPVQFTGNGSGTGIGTVEITGLPAVSQLRVRITMQNNSANEAWIVDDFKIGTNITVSSSTLNIPVLLPSSTHTYTISAIGTNATSTSNTISVSIPAAVIPTLGSATFANVTNTSADLTTSVTDIGSTEVLSARGIALKTTAGVTLTDNPQAESSATTGTFTQTRTLSPETRYYFRGYATNAEGTGYSTENNFITRSNPPTSAATSLTATPFSASQLDLSWISASFPSSGATNKRYALLMATAPNTPSFIATNAVGIEAGANTTIVNGAISSSATGASALGLTAGTEYNFVLVPYTWNGTDSATINFYTADAATTSGTTTTSLPPVVVSPTVTSITESSAVLGARVSSDGGEALAARGVVYSINSPVTINDAIVVNASADTGVYSDLVTPLDPQTTYYFAGVASNGGAIGLSSQSSFTTFSNPPSAQASTLTASAVSGTQINLSWSAATFPTTGASVTGYVLLRALHPNTPAITNGNGHAPVADANTTIVSSSISGSATNASSNGLTAETHYNYALIPFTWNGTNAATYNYLTTSAPSADATTLAATPVAQPFSMAFSNLTCNGMTVSWRRAATAPTGYIVLQTSGASLPNTDPVSGTAYSVGSTLGNATVVYVGNDSTINVSGLSDNTNHNFEVLSYNGSGNGNIAYLTTAPLISSSLTANAPAPVATAGTEMSITGFKANWNASSCASSYKLDVSTYSGFRDPATAVTTIAAEGFESGLSLFSASGTGGSVRTGSSTSSDKPASSPFFTEGNSGYGAVNGTAILTSSAINTSAYENNSLNLRLAAFGLGGTNGPDGTFDQVKIEISPDGGTSWYSTATFNGNNSAYWAYSSTGTATTSYDADNTAINFAAPNSGSNTTAVSTITINNLPRVLDMRVRITMQTNGVTELWVIDDVKVTGFAGSYLSSYNDATVAGTSQTITSLSPNTTYYYRVRGVGANSTSLNSNTISVTTDAGFASLGSPTVSSITQNSAILGAAVLTAGSGEGITDRGTVYSTSAAVTSSNNALSEGGTTIDAFTHSRTGLSPETRYYFAGYATNSYGTGLSPVSSFITWSNPPTAAASSLTATPISGDQINLSWSAATFPTTGATATGYVVVRADYPNTPSISNGNGQAPAAGANSTIVMTVNGASTSAAAMSLAAVSRYNFTVIPFTWNGVNDSTRHYFTNDAPLADATTFIQVTASAPTNFTTNGVTCNAMTVKWTPGANADGSLVLMSTGATAPNTSPLYTVEYSVGNSIGNATVVYVGSGDSVNLTGLGDNVNHQFRIISYNGSGVNIGYLTSSFLAGSRTTLTPSAPVANSASSISSSSFTANWDAVSPCANGYKLYVSSTAATLSESFENSMSLFTNSGGTYYSGNGTVPATPRATAGTFGFGANNTTATLTSVNINNGSTSSQLSFRLGAFTSSTTNGLDAPDSVNVEISPNGGTTWFNTLRISGASANSAYWGFSGTDAGTGTATASYDGDNNPTTFQAGGSGARTTDGVSTVVVNNLPISSNLRVRITLKNNATSEFWIIDQFAFTIPSVPVSGFNGLTVSGTTQSVTGLSASTAYTYYVTATGANSNSPASNNISATTYADPSISDYRTKASGNFSSASVWQYNYDGTNWTDAPQAPTSGNNITIQSADSINMDQSHVVNAGKSFNVRGKVETGANVISGSGTFTLDSLASIYIGHASGLYNSTTVTGAVTTTTRNFNGGANYIYNGTAQQTNNGLPGTVTGNVIIANAAGMLLTSSKAVNTPGTYIVKSGAKVNFGTGIGTNAINLTGTGNFLAETGSTLSITSSAGITNDGTTGNIRFTGTRTFSSGINYELTRNDGTSTSSFGSSFGTEITGINNLTINNAVGASLSGSNITVNGVLNLVAGKLSTGANKVTIASGGSLTKTDTAWVIGNLEKAIATGATTATYEVGPNSSSYTPVTVTFGNVTNAGNLNVNATNGAHPNLGSSTISTTKRLSFYAGLNGSGGLAFDNYSATINFNNANVLGSANTGAFIVGNYTGSTWSYPTVSSAGSSAITSTGLTALGDIIAGELNCQINATAGTNSPICYLDSIKLNANVVGNNGSVTYSWSGPFAFSSSDQNPYIAFATGSYEGEYTLIVTDDAGCRDTSTTQVVINLNSSTLVYDTICSSLLPYLWNGNSYNSGGEHSWTGTNAVGCDSTVYLYLTVTSSTSNITTISACDSYTWSVNSQTYTGSGSYTSTSGCQSEILNLTITSSTSNTTTISSCDSYTWSVNGQTYTTSGARTSVSGCHTEILDLTITASTSNTTVASVCDSYTWSVNGQTYTTSGSRTSTSGCHTEILDLTITASTSNTTVASVCDSYTWSVNGQTYTESGSYTSVSGCATRVLNLTITASTTPTTTASTCDSYVWAVTGQTYTTSGSYTSVSGCATSILNLTINESKSSSSNATACGSYILPWGTTVTTGGSYSNVYPTVAGCDSTVTVNVTINVATSSTSDVSICASAAPYVWNGNSYSTSGSRTFTTTNAAGCDSTAVLNLTVNVATSFTQIVTACNSFSWNGQTYTTSGSRTFTTTNAAGCDSTAILNLTISTALPATPGAITQTLVNNSCGARRYRFSVPFVSASITYSWSFNSSAVASTATIDSGGTGNVILATFTSNAIAATTDSVRVRAVNGCGSSANVRLKLTNTAWAPLAPPVITTTNLITNVCGGRKVRYSIPVPATTAGSVAIEWSFVGSVLGANAVIDSGTSSSTKIVVLYTSNLAAVANDSVRVRYNYNSGCSFGAFVRSKISLTSYLPATPAAPSITLVSNACGAKTYRYRSAASLPAATATTAAATGWFWSFTGTLGANAVIDSGDANSQTILVRFTSNAAAAASGDSVRVCYTSDCGNGANGKAKLTNVVTAPPAKPASLGITLVANNCGAKVYRYAAPALVAQTATTAAATGWLWSFTGTLGANAVIDSGDANSRTILVRFTSNAAAAASGDSVRVSYTSSCGNSANNVAKLTNVVTTVPVAPASPIITTIDANTCGARRYRYRAASATLPAATATATAATGWLWSFTGTLGANATIDSGNINSSVITVTFTSNAAAAASGDSVRLQYTSSCGNSGFGRTKLSNTLFATPTPATAPAITLVSDVCGARVYRYRAPALVSATATAPAATGWQWSFVGTLGLNAVVDSGSLTSQVVVMRFTSNDGAATGDSARVAYTSACGTGAFKSTKLSNVAKLGCPPPPPRIAASSLFVVNVYPNPSQGQFNVQLSGATSEEVSVRVQDAQGRFIKSIRSASNGTITLGSDLRPGSYMLEVRQGRNVKTTRVLKY